MSGGRPCPRCSTLIESSSAVFCYNCGQELLNISALPTPAAEELLPKKKPFFPARKFSLAKILLPGAFLIALFPLLFFWTLQNKKSRPIPGLLQPTANDFVSTVSALPQAPITFGKEVYAGLTPAKADLYLEGGSLKNFLAKFLDSAGQKRLEETLGLTLEESVSFFEPSFVFIKSASGSALLSQTRDLDFTKNRLIKLQKSEVSKNFQADLVGDVLVVSDSLSLLDDVRAVSKKSQLSLLMKAGFLESLKKLPREGQLFIYSSNLENVLYALRIFFGSGLENALGALRGTTFVVTSRNGSLVLIGPND